MPANPAIPLLQATAPVDSSLCDIKTPQDILDLVAENMVADSQAVFTAINNGIYFGATEPTGDNFGKLWVKSTGGGPSNPRGVGIVVNGSYVILPIPADAAVSVNDVPPGAILINSSSTVPDGYNTYPGTPPVGSIYIIKT